jgi:hypothetical protein
MLQGQIAVQAVLKKQQQNVLYEVEVCSLLIIAIDADGEVLANSEDENMKRCEVGAIRAVWIRAMLEEDPDAVKIENLSARKFD